MTKEEGWQIAIAVVYAAKLNVVGYGEMVPVASVINIVNAHLERGWQITNERVSNDRSRWELVHTAAETSCA